MTTINEALIDARRRLQAASPSPAVDASILLCHVLACSRSHLIAWPEQVLSDQQLARFNDVLQQRLRGKPVAYITGEREFWSVSLQVNDDVLIPRAETETLVEFVLQKFADRKRLEVVDLGTGSGAIACALAFENKHWNIIATDTSEAALAVARTNASAHELNNIRFIKGHWFEPLAGRRFDLVISNPPYVARDDPHLEQGDVRFEPDTALVSGEKGMDAITHLAQQAGLYLDDGGWLVVEHGYDQQAPVKRVFEQNGFVEIVQIADLAGQPRLTAGRHGQTKA